MPKTCRPGVPVPGREFCEQGSMIPQDCSINACACREENIKVM